MEHHDLPILFEEWFLNYVLHVEMEVVVVTWRNNDWKVHRDYLCGATELNNAKCIGIVAVLTEDFVYLIGDGVTWRHIVTDFFIAN